MSFVFSAVISMQKAAEILSRRPTCEASSSSFPAKPSMSSAKVKLAIYKQSTKVNKTLLSALPYFNYSDLISAHGQFNNSLSSSLPTKKYLDRLPSYYDLDLFTLNTF